MIGHSLTASESWMNLPWKKFRRELFRLQNRVFKSDVFGGSFPRKARAAVRVGDKRKARSLQKLILKSQASRLLAIRQVTQLNAGKKTAGIDNKKSLSFEERFGLSNELKININTWKHQGLREIPIPKKDGTTRILKVLRPDFTHHNHEKPDCPRRTKTRCFPMSKSGNQHRIS